MAKNNKQAPGDNPGFVYLIRRGPYYKVGHTNMMYWRLKTIDQAVTPSDARQYPVEEVWSIECADKITTERALHQRFAQYHAGFGEWFFLPTDVVNWLCRQTEASICEGYDSTRHHRPDSTRYR